MNIVQRIASNTILKRKQTPMIGELVIGTGEDKYGKVLVPQEFADSVYDAIYKDGMQKPDYAAHISVFNTDELKAIGEVEDVGKYFEFTIGGIESCDPDNWYEMEEVWFVQCHSKQLEDLRSKYNLTPLMNGDHEFHITIAQKPKKYISESQYEVIAKKIFDDFSTKISC